MTREEAIRRIKAWNLDPDDMEVLSVVIPELAESEDERIRKQILDCFGTMRRQGCFPSKHKEQYDSWISWLEKQKEKRPLTAKEYHDKFDEMYGQYKPNLVEQKPAEWSERENKMLASAISHIVDSECFDHFHDITKADIISWLKSLRPSWKPSEEQMEALKDAVKLYKDTHFENFHQRIESLYEQLKAL